MPLPAFAQSGDDPFALPTTATLDNARTADAGPLMSEIVIDGRSRARMVRIEGRGQDLTIDAGDARAAGLPVADDVRGPVRLDSLKVYQWKFDGFRQRLSIALLRENDGVNLKDLSAVAYEPSESRPLTTFRLDYDLTGTATARGAEIGGLFDAALVRGNLSIATSARVVGATISGQLRATRLNTQVQFLWDRKALVGTAGDFVSAGSASQRSVRMGGLQLATDATFRPDLVSTPLPAFSGAVAVPTTIDLVSADTRREVGQLEPGAFTVRNIPVPLGRGEMSAVLRDALGRETVQTVRFYISNDLLAKGRSAYAVNFGFVRRRYGELSSAYGPAAASAFYRRGLSSNLTVETSAEWTRGLANVGARADFTILKLAKATFEGRFSRDAQVGTGKMLNLGLESVGAKLGGLLGATLPGATYRDVASKLGDPALPRRIFASAFYRPTKDFRLQVSAVRTDERANPRLRTPARRIDSLVGSADWRVSRKTRVIFAGEYRNFAGQAETSVSAGLSLYFGKRAHLAAQGRYGSADRTAEIVFARERDEPGQVGTSLSARHDNGVEIFTGRAEWRAPMAELRGEAELAAGRPAARLSARGSLLLVGGQFLARNTSSQGFAIVQAGKVSGVPITLENRFVGKTDKKGRLFVDDIVPHIPVKIDVDPKQLPRDALVRESKHVIRVSQRAVALVEIDAIRFRPVLRTIHDARGAPLAAGLPVRAEPSGERTLTGYDGLLEINAGAEDRRLVVGHPGATCVVELAAADLSADEGPPLRCEPRLIAENEPASAWPAREKRRGRKPAENVIARAD